MVRSPFSNKIIDNHEAIYLVDEIITGYSREFNIDVGTYFKDREIIKLFKCADTGYEFFYPYEIAGDSTFYTQLEKYDWYYIPWKWEHQKATNYIKEKDKVLEIGAGNGDFLIFIKKMMDVAGIGLELNSSAVKKGMDKGANLVEERIQVYSQQHAEQFDVVCLFQVLEHIAQVKEVIESCLKCLKPNGYLIISVPNNDSFIKMDKYNLLNLPPHHMGRWRESPLRSLSEIFKMRLVEIHIEPLQENHMEWYIYLHLHKWIKSEFLRKAVDYLFLKLFVSKIIKLIRNKIAGHSIMATYQK